MADVSVTAANVLPLSAGTSTGIAGAAITAGQTLYADSANGNVLKLADANASAATSVVVGVALNGAATGQPVTYANSGIYTPGFTVTVGAVYVQSATAGAIAPVADLASGYYTNVLGIGVTSSQLMLIIKTAGVAVP